jgi:hypothetical protein
MEYRGENNEKSFSKRVGGGRERGITILVFGWRLG